MAHDFGATNEPGTCLWCGVPLRPEYRHTERSATDAEIEAKSASEVRAKERTEAEYDRPGRDLYAPPPQFTSRHDIRRIGERWLKRESTPTGRSGWEGNGLFCTLRCGEAFGIALAKNGRRLTPVKPESQ